MDNWLIIVMNIGAWLAMLVFFLWIRRYLPTYFNEKAKNLATKEDIGEITDRVEAVKNEYARQLELFKNEIALLDKRREISAQVVDLINRYKELPPRGVASDPKKMRAFEQDYYKIVPWVPSDVLNALNSLFSESVQGKAKPDIKDVIIQVRQSILGKDSGEFKGKDLVHFVGFGNII